MEQLQYPIGRFARPESLTPETRAAAIHDLIELPARIRAAVDGLSEEQCNTPYREGGWTIRQVIHHLADSHMAAFVRTKTAYTEDNPAVSPLPWDAWAALPDYKAPLCTSLSLIENVHTRWVLFWSSVDEKGLARTMNHSKNGPQTLDHYLHLYAWHGKHHTAHVTSLRQRNGW